MDDGIEDGFDSGTGNLNGSLRLLMRVVKRNRERFLGNHGNRRQKAAAVKRLLLPAAQNCQSRVASRRQLGNLTGSGLVVTVQRLLSNSFGLSHLYVDTVSLYDSVHDSVHDSVLS